MFSIEIDQPLGAGMQALAASLSTLARFVRDLQRRAEHDAGQSVPPPWPASIAVPPRFQAAHHPSASSHSSPSINQKDRGTDSNEINDQMCLVAQEVALRAAEIVRLEAGCWDHEAFMFGPLQLGAADAPAQEGVRLTTTIKQIIYQTIHRNIC